MAFEHLANEIYTNIDLVWVVVALIVLHEGQRAKTAILFGACYLFLRLQIELLNAFGYPNGLFNLMETGLYHRGLICYSITNILFLVASIWSPNTKGVLFLASAISAFVIAATISSIILIL
jgi:hypothetical protein